MSLDDLELVRLPALLVPVFLVEFPLLLLDVIIIPPQNLMLQFSLPARLYEMSINVQFSDEEIIHKMKMREQADCFEQRWKEACSIIWIYMNYDADENNHLCSLIYWLATEL